MGRGSAVRWPPGAMGLDLTVRAKRRQLLPSRACAARLLRCSPTTLLALRGRRPREVAGRALGAGGIHRSAVQKTRPTGDEDRHGRRPGPHQQGTALSANNHSLCRDDRFQHGRLGTATRRQGAYRKPCRNLVSRDGHGPAFSARTSDGSAAGLSGRVAGSAELTFRCERSGDDGVGDGRVAGTVAGVLGDGEWSRVSETHRPLVTSGDASEWWAVGGRSLVRASADR